MERTGPKPRRRGWQGPIRVLRVFVRRWIWPAVLASAVGALVFGIIGFDQYVPAGGPDPSIGDDLYRTLQLFVFEFNPFAVGAPWEVDVARILAAFSSVVVGLAAIAVIFREQRSRFFARYVARRHVVVAGLGPCGALMAKGFEADDVTVVAVEASATTSAEECRELGTTVIIGDATDAFLLSSLGVKRATTAVVSCGADGVNARVTAGIADVLSERKARRWRTRRGIGPLSCHVHIEDEGLWRMLAGSVVGNRADARDAGPVLDVQFFNPSEIAAPGMYTTGDMAVTRPTPTSPAHALVVGLGEMGRELVTHMARCWWIEHGPGLGKLRVTLVDLAVEERMLALLEAPGLKDHLEIVEAKTLDVNAPEFATGAFMFDASGKLAITAAYVCLDDDSRGLGAALALRARLRQGGDDAATVPVVVRLTTSTGVASLVDQRRGGQDPHLLPFGLADWACTPQVLLDRTNEILARQFHAQYVGERFAENADPAKYPAMRPWDELSAENRASNRAMAADVDQKLEAIGCVKRPLEAWEGELETFTDPEVEKLAEMEHERWWAFKKGHGYRRGEPTRLRKKRNPLMIPWDQLTDKDKEYDRIPVRNLPRLLLRAGYLVHRTGKSQP